MFFSQVQRCVRATRLVSSPRPSAPLTPRSLPLCSLFVYISTIWICLNIETDSPHVFMFEAHIAIFFFPLQFANHFISGFSCFSSGNQRMLSRGFKKKKFSKHILKTFFLEHIIFLQQHSELNKSSSGLKVPILTHQYSVVMTHTEACMAANQQ